MTITALSGPLLSYGLTQSASGAVADYNEERGPSAFDLGSALSDPRSVFNYDPGSAVGTKVFVFFDNKGKVDYVPVAISTNAIGSNVAPAAGAALTLTNSTAAGVVQTTIVAPETGKAVTVLCIDSTASYVTFGSGGTIAAWNPAAGAGRCVTLNPSGNSSLDGGNWSIAGRDIYGIKLTELVAASSQAMTTKKAFKYVSSVIAATTIGSTGVVVGFSDTYGLPLLATYNSVDTACRINATSSVTASPAQSNVALTLGATGTATNTTGDVRGTWASSVASNGTARVQIVQSFTTTMVNSVTASDQSGVFGVTQFSSV